uniref:Uncharacterized protein n=1 Tax=Rhizophora mucronata TaxID=61149 RepID=A0A2P2P960_RHIMU
MVNGELKSFNSTTPHLQTNRLDYKILCFSRKPKISYGHTILPTEQVQ